MFPFLFSQIGTMTVCMHSWGILPCIEHTLNSFVIPGVFMPFIAFVQNLFWKTIYREMTITHTTKLTSCNFSFGTHFNSRKPPFRSFLHQPCRIYCSLYVFEILRRKTKCKYWKQNLETLANLHKMCWEALCKFVIDLMLKLLKTSLVRLLRHNSCVHSNKLWISLNQSKPYCSIQIDYCICKLQTAVVCWWPREKSGKMK